MIADCSKEISVHKTAPFGHKELEVSPTAQTTQ